MRSLLVVVPFCLAVVGCDSGPKIDASSPEAFVTSMRGLTEGLPEHQRQAISRAFELLNSSCVATSTAGDLAAKYEACETSVRDSLNGKSLNALASMAREALDQLVALESNNATNLRTAISETVLEPAPTAPGYFVSRFTVVNGGTAPIQSMQAKVSFGDGTERECRAYFTNPIAGGATGTGFCDFTYSDIFEGQTALPSGASATATAMEISFDDGTSWRLDATTNAERWRSELINIP